MLSHNYLSDRLSNFYFIVEFPNLRNIGATLGNVQMTSSPSQVSESATLKILVSPITPIPANGMIKVTIPSSTSITQGTVACTMVRFLIVQYDILLIIYFLKLCNIIVVKIKLNKYRLNQQELQSLVYLPVNKLWLQLILYSMSASSN